MMHIDIIVDEVRLKYLKINFEFFLKFCLASDAFKRNISPIIIDNTNTQAWEMKPYVAMVNIQCLSLSNMN
jgi:hypothetical protein